MSVATFLTLASIEAVRPVFLIVMGAFILLIALRLAKSSGRWTSRLMVAGALLLAFGYAILLPLYEAGVIEKYAPNGHSHGSEATAMAWHTVKLVAMNLGWLIFGLGLAMHAGILGSFSPRTLKPTRIISPHESAA